jgi:type IV pilus assembly protein PilC
MPTYVYEALNAAGKPEKGRIEADNSDAAMAAVRQNGFFPTTIREEKAKGSSAKAASKKEAAKKGKKKKGGFNISIGGVKTKVLTQFTRQLSTLQDAGLPLLRSLQILELQQKPGKLKSILGDVVEDVESGTALSDAMSKHPKAFDRLYCKMVAAGEIGGVLDVILQRLAGFMEKSERLKARIKGAMIYPICVIVVAVGIVSGIMYFVIPKFKDIFDDFDVTLPGITLFLIDLSLWVAGTPEGKVQAIPGWVWIMLFIVSLLISTIVCHILFAKSQLVIIILFTIRSTLFFNLLLLLFCMLGFGRAFLQLIPLISDSG